MINDKKDGIDSEPTKPEKNVARAQPVVAQTAESVLADEIASNVQIRPGDSVRDIILAHPAVRQLIVASAVRSLNATKFYYSKSEGGMVHEPDFAAQLKAVAWLASYSDGLPVVTNVNLNANTSGKDRGNVPMTPAMLEAMERMVARAKVGAGKPEMKLVADSDIET